MLLLLLSVSIVFTNAVSQEEYSLLCDLGRRMLPFYNASYSLAMLAGCTNACPSFAVCANTTNNTTVVTSLSIYFIGGSLPTNLGIFSGLRTLVIKSTLTTGNFPQSICNLTSLNSLTISSTPLRGIVPECIFSPGLLSHLDLSNNLFSGTIPYDINRSPLRNLYLNNNLFSGQLPYLSSTVEAASVANNAFDSGLDSRITMALNLRVFSANNNRLSGTIPEDLTLVAYRNLVYLNVANNRLSGQIPYLSPSLVYLDISYNQYTAINVTLDFVVHSYRKIVEVDMRGNRIVDAGATAKFLLDNQDIDECALLRYVCPDNSYCSDGWNPKMSYTCKCNEGYSLSSNGKCLDINECLTANACGHASCVNLEGSYYCCEGSKYNPAPETLNATCFSCYTDYTYVMNANPTTGLQNISSYLRCFGECSVGTSYKIRSIKSDACSVEAPVAEYCQYPCTDLDTEGAPAKIVVEMLYNEVTRGSYLEELAGVSNVTVLHEASTSTLTIQCVQNCSLVIDLIHLVIGKGATVSVKAYNASVIAVITTATIAPAARIEAIVLSVVGMLFMCCIVIYIAVQYSYLDVLPEEVRETIRPSIFMRCFWGYQGNANTGYYYTDYDYNSNGGTRNFPISLEGYTGYTIQKIYNKTLVSNFLGAYKIQKERMAGGFGNRHGTPTKDVPKEELEAKYKELCRSYPWNRAGNPNIIVGCHSTNSAAATSICTTGFACLSKLDAGWYGKGIYFSTYSEYTLRYSGYKPDVIPSLIISYLIPGNAYAVVEGKDTKSTPLSGTAIKSGYQSHYVRVCTNGYVGDTYDEIVVSLESQILPIYIVSLDPDNAYELAKAATSLSAHYVKLG